MIKLIITEDQRKEIFHLIRNRHFLKVKQILNELPRLKPKAMKEEDVEEIIKESKK